MYFFFLLNAFVSIEVWTFFLKASTESFWCSELFGITGQDRAPVCSTVMGPVEQGRCGGRLQFSGGPATP